MKGLRHRTLYTIFLLVFLLGFFPASVGAAGPETLPMKDAPTGNNAFIRVPGRFVSLKDRAAIDRVLQKINLIRKEAVQLGYADRYVPLTWSEALSKVAHLRAAEASLFFDHERLTGATWIVSTIHDGESLAINGMADAMLFSIDQYYAEKEDWESVHIHGVDPEKVGQTGHYDVMIMPDFKTVGAGGFVPDGQSRDKYGVDYYTSTALAFSYERPKEAVRPFPERATMLLETNDLRLKEIAWTKRPTSLATGKSATFSVSGVIHTYDWIIYPKDRYRTSVAMGNFSSSDPRIATIDKRGIVTGHRAGTVTITFRLGQKRLTSKLTVSGPDRSSNIADPIDHSKIIPPPPLRTGRISGASRWDVAANVARTYFPKAKEVLVVNYQAFGDAISAANLSNGQMPVLYSKAGSLPKATIDAIQAMKPTKITLLGGPVSLNERLVQQLKQSAPNAVVRRIFGRDRFSVNMISAQSFDGSQGGVDLVVANGMVYSDALIATPLAAQMQAPVLLVKPTSIPPDIKLWLKALGHVRSVTIVGGERSISPKVMREIGRLTDTKPVRLGGKDRYQLSAVVAQRGYKNPWKMLVASGETFADALAAAPLSQALDAPILLTRRSRLDPTVLSYLRNASALRAMGILGGKRTIAPSLEKQLLDFIR